MAQTVAKKYSDELEDLIKCVRGSLDYFKENNQRFRSTRSFVFDSNITQAERSKLDSIKKPPVQANSLSVFLSRLKGEFSWQSPSFKVTGSSENPNPDMAQINFCENKLEAIKNEADKYGFSNHVYTDQVSGGFSVMKMWSDYISPYSNKQNIYWGNAFDPTLCGFDPLARAPHKGDGAYCFECVPITVDELKKIYPHADVSKLSYTRSVAGINFSFKSVNEDKIALLVYFYKKKRKKIKILSISTGQDLTEEQYARLIKIWEEQNRIEQEPKVVSSRTSYIDIICRYVFIETQVLEYLETELSGFPLVFVDGDSLILHSDNTDGKVNQFTRPTVHSALDLQRAKNLAFQTACNNLENMVQHKFMAPREAIHPNDIEAWKNPQLPSTLLYKHLDEQGNPLPPPIAVNIPPLSPEVMEIYKMMDDSIQTALGSFDPMYSNLTKQQISGRAVVEAATQNNASAMPYVTNFMIALNRLCQITIDYFPKIFTSPQLVPVIDKTGQKQLQPLNMPDEPNNLMLDYRNYEFQVEVTPGVNFEIQKNQSLQVLQGLAAAFPVVGEFINTKGLPIIMSNISIRGAPQLQELADQFQSEIVQQKMQAANNQPPPNPALLKVQNEQQLAPAKMQLENRKLDIEEEKVKNTKFKNLIDAKNAQDALALESRKVDEENVRTITDIANKHMDRTLEGAKHILDHTHKMTQALQNIQPLPTGEISDENETP